MKFTLHQLENQLADVLRTRFQQIPAVSEFSLEPQPQAQGADIELTLRTPAGPQTVLVEFKSSGQPRIARDAINQLLAFQAKRPGAYGVFAAPYISDKSAQLCSEANIGYIDLAGNCRLSFDGVFIEIRGNPNPFTEKRELKSLFAPKAERILRTLLGQPRRIWKTEDLARTAKVSFGQVTNVRRLLEEREWISKRRPGFELTQPLALLESWRSQYRPDRCQQTRCYAMATVGEIEANIAERCNRDHTRYALTGFSGAGRYAPFTSYQTVTVYVDYPPEGFALLANLKPVTSGANVVLLTPYDEGVFFGQRNVAGQIAASPIQCYLDLKREFGRNEEAAEALLESVIKPSW